MILFGFHSKLKIHPVLFLLSILVPSFCIAQSDSTKSKTLVNPIVYEFELDNGGILMQKGLENSTYKNAYYQGIHLRVGWKQMSNNDSYNQLYHHPVYGIGFYSGTFSNNVIGNPYALYGFIQVPLKSEYPKWSYDYRIGLGLSGNFKPFDKINNPLNLVIGSKNNVYIDFGFRAQYKFHTNWKAGIGFSFHHFSNGALVLPNKGVNLVPLSLSINYQPEIGVPGQKDDIIKPYSRNWMYDINFGMGFKQLQEDLDERYLKTTLGIYASRHISHKWRIGGGLDIFYSSSGNKENIAGDQYGKTGSVLSGGPSFYLVHVLKERLTLNGNIGYYLHHQEFNGEENSFFLRAGTRYYVYRNLNAGVSIKAHMGKADFIEWTLGYTFNK